MWGWYVAVSYRNDGFSYYCFVTSSDEVMPVNTTKPVEEKDVTEKPKGEEIPDRDVEEVEMVMEDDDECEDGEWVYEEPDTIEQFERLVDAKSTVSIFL